MKGIENIESVLRVRVKTETVGSYVFEKDDYMLLDDDRHDLHS